MFIKDPIESNTSCVFPKEFQDYQWYSLNQSIEMIITNHDIQFIHSHSKDDKQRYHCLQSFDAFNYRIRTFRNW